MKKNLLKRVCYSDILPVILTGIMFVTEITFCNNKIHKSEYYFTAYLALCKYTVHMQISLCHYLNRYFIEMVT